MKGDDLYLHFIKECIDDIHTFISEGEKEFFQNKKTQYAVIRALQILAESTQRISPDLTNEYPEVDWRGISGFRNVLVHDYFGLNPVRIWEIIENDLPILDREISRMIKKVDTIQK